MTESVTPNDMPGATVDDPVAETTTEQPEVTETKGLSADKLAELNRTLRDERNQWKREAREAKEQADALVKQFSDLKSQLGVDKEADFNPKDAFDALQKQFESERTERLRVDVARTTGVDPKFIHGSTEDAMRESAEDYLADINKRIEDALKAKNVPAAPPASTVTANDPISGPQQITSHEELKKLSPSERVKAYKDGRLDSLVGKS